MLMNSVSASTNDMDTNLDIFRFRIVAPFADE
jgi:hypothetical protein